MFIISILNWIEMVSNWLGFSQTKQFKNGLDSVQTKFILAWNQTLAILV